MECVFNPGSIDDYRRFLAVKRLPRYRITGHTAWFPDEYASVLGMTASASVDNADYDPKDWLFDYQADIVNLAIRRKKFAIFAECGLGKQAMIFEFARHAAAQVPGKIVLIVAPLMVVDQAIQEEQKFYAGELRLQRVVAKDLPAFLKTGSGIAITNYDAIRDDLEQGNLGCLILDESSMLKSAYGKWGTTLIRLGKGLGYKLCATGTPAPNDRIEYGNHAVFLDHFPTINSFYARYFVNRGQTQNRWEMKPHALEPFYRSLSHWCIFLNNPATYGWKDNTDTLPPVNVHIHDVPLTQEQADITYARTGSLFTNDLGGITNRSVLSQIAKGNYRGKPIPTNKPAFIRSLVDSFDCRSTIIWCNFNPEQDLIAKAFPGCANIDGSTKYADRVRLIGEFKAGERKVLVSKPEILGFGLNLQIATRMVFSGMDDSFEDYHQAVKRANRVGSTEPLEVHIPVTDIERPMLENVLRKAARVEQDTRTQEEMFRNATIEF